MSHFCTCRRLVYVIYSRNVLRNCECKYFMTFLWQLCSSIYSNGITSAYTDVNLINRVGLYCTFCAQINTGASRWLTIMLEHTFPDSLFSLTTLKFPDFSRFSRFSRWVATLCTVTWNSQLSRLQESWQLGKNNTSEKPQDKCKLYNIWTVKTKKKRRKATKKPRKTTDTGWGYYKTKLHDKILCHTTEKKYPTAKNTRQIEQFKIQ